MRNILPTHTCFTDAMELLAEAIQSNEGSAESNELLLVHAICLLPSGEEFSHAWVECLGKYVWFVGILDGKREQFAADLNEYYIDARVKETTKYTPIQVWQFNRKHVTYGPWEEKYQRLCKEKTLNEV